MVQPTPPTDGGTPAPSYPSYDAGSPSPGTDTGWTAPATSSWTAPPAPSWTAPWPQPGEQLVSEVPPGPARRTTPRGPLVLALVALAGLLAGAIGAAFLVMAVFVGSAEEIGREIGAELGPQVGRAAGDRVAEAMEDVVEPLLEGGMMEEEYGWGAAPGPVEQHPPVEPGDLGPDPVLDQYAQDCFAGTLQSCDDLLYQSPPLSEYERYAFTCGGRVKQYDVMSCTDLE